MIRNILKADAMMGVTSPRQLAEKHAATLAKLRMRGVQAEEHRDDSAVAARVDEGRWLFDCKSCPSGVAAHPDWMEARCFGCGAVYTAVQFPENREAIEAALVELPMGARNWTPGE